MLVGPIPDVATMCVCARALCVSECARLRALRACGCPDVSNHDRRFSARKRAHHLRTPTLLQRPAQRRIQSTPARTWCPRGAMFQRAIIGCNVLLPVATRTAALRRPAKAATTAPGRRRAAPPACLAAAACPAAETAPAVLRRLLPLLRRRRRHRRRAWRAGRCRPSPTGRRWARTPTRACPRPPACGRLGRCGAERPRSRRPLPRRARRWTPCSRRGTWWGPASARGATCGRGERSPGADASGRGAAQAQMRAGRAPCRCGSGEPGPGADVAGVSPVPAQTWQRRASDFRCCVSAA